MIESSAQALPVALGHLPAADWAAAVVVRHSARTFTGEAVAATELQRLRCSATACPRPRSPE